METGYDRTIKPGAPTPAKYLYFPNPITAAVNFLAAIPTGWDNGIAITGDPSEPAVPHHRAGSLRVRSARERGAVDPYGLPPGGAGSGRREGLADIRRLGLLLPARPRPAAEIESPTETVVPQGISSPQGFRPGAGTRPIKTAAPAAASIGADRTQRPNRDRA